MHFLFPLQMVMSFGVTWWTSKAIFFYCCIFKKESYGFLKEKVLILFPECNGLDYDNKLKTMYYICINNKAEYASQN